jgi:hypothetical protein
MKPATELVTGGLEKINPMKVLTYDESHKKVTKIHKEMIKNIVPSGLVDRAEKETEKMVRGRK